MLDSETSCKIQPFQSPEPFLSSWLVSASYETWLDETAQTCTFPSPAYNQDAQPSMLHVTSATAYPYILALVHSAKSKQGNGALTFFLDSFYFLRLYPHFLNNFSDYLASSFFPSLSDHAYTLYIKYIIPPPTPPFSLPSHFLPPLLSSPFNFSLSSLCSPLTPSSERPIRLHRGFTARASEGKPKWNSAHLLE